MESILQRRRLTDPLAALLLLSMTATAGGQIIIPPTNHWIGPEAACDYPDIQSAIDDVFDCFLCAPTEDRFLLSLNYVHSGKFELNDSVSIIGGYTSCEGTQTGARHTLSSTGPGALITLNGPFLNPIEVHLVNLALLGNNSVSTLGGVIEVKDGVELTLENSQVSGGQAIQGGGVALHSGFGTNRLVLSDATISSNVALADGGGIWCQNGGEIDFRSGLISGNSAETRGGGIGLDDCRLTGSAINETRRIANNAVNRANAPNAAGKGGGIYARDSARVELGGLLTRTTIEDNIVAKWTDATTPSLMAAHGGGMHLQLGARAELRNVQFIDNEAPGGGAISMERGARLDMDRTSGPCLTSRPSECSAMIGNTASGQSPANQDYIRTGRGSAIQAVGFSGQPGVTIDLRRTTLRDNLAMDHDGTPPFFNLVGSMIDATGSGHRVRLEQNLIFSNLIEGDTNDDGDYFDVNGIELELIHNTIAFHDEAESIIERGAPITLVGNIFWNPQLDDVIGDNDAAVLSACNVSDQDIPAGLQHTNSMDDPMFVDFSTGDFRLSQGSPAINRCDRDDSRLPVTGFDIEGRERPVPDGGGALLGSYDSGALEHHLSSADEIDLTITAVRTDDDSQPGATFGLTITNVGLTAAGQGNFNISFQRPPGGFEVVGDNWNCLLTPQDAICILQLPFVLDPGQSALMGLQVAPNGAGECSLYGSSDSGTQPDTDPSNNRFAIVVPDCDEDGILPEDVFSDGFE